MKRVAWIRGILIAAASSMWLVAQRASAQQAADTAQVPGSAEPVYAGYRALLQELPRYRALAEDSSLRLPSVYRRAVRPGDEFRGTGSLAHLLTALGDLPSSDLASDDALPSMEYTGALVGAVANFQRRHGLEIDSIIGPATWAQLRVPLADRVLQIEVALERWRWLPERPPARYVIINIPEFRLYVFENDSAAEHPLLEMKIIAGEARNRHQTPMFTGVMREVVFRPYWDVPPRIARNELIPAIRRSAGYFEKEELEIVRGDGEDGSRYAPNATNLSRVAAGTLRLRQRPGTTNALGLVKFIFPNQYNTYLHGTPSPQLFEYARRDFSHGCMRAEEPAELAEFVLEGQAEWDRPAIDSAMQGRDDRHVNIERPVSVFVWYATVVAKADGLYFLRDIYGRDAAVRQQLTLASGSGRVSVTKSSVRSAEAPRPSAMRYLSAGEVSGDDGQPDTECRTADKVVRGKG